MKANAQISPVRPTPGTPPSTPGVPPFAQVYAEHAPFVWRSLRRLGVREADLEDTCQEVFVTVHRKLPRLRGALRADHLALRHLSAHRIGLATPRARAPGRSPR